jgi:hypothetical protein
MSGEVVLQALGDGSRVLDHEEVAGVGDGETFGMGEPGLHELATSNDSLDAVRADDVEHRLRDAGRLVGSELELLVDDEARRRPLASVTLPARRNGLHHGAPHPGRRSRPTAECLAYAGPRGVAS